MLSMSLKIMDLMTSLKGVLITYEVEYTFASHEIFVSVQIQNSFLVLKPPQITLSLLKSIQLKQPHCCCCLYKQLKSNDRALLLELDIPRLESWPYLLIILYPQATYIISLNLIFPYFKMGISTSQVKLGLHVCKVSITQ